MDQAASLPKQIVRDYLQRIEDRDAPAAAALIADDATWWIVGAGNMNKDAIKGIHLSLFGLTNAMGFTILGQIAEGDQVATQAKVVYYTKDGRTLDNDIVLIATVKGGKIQDAREFYNIGAPPLKLE